MRESLWRVANEQMRSATIDENRGAEIFHRFLGNTRLNIRDARDQRKHVDVTEREHPGSPEIQTLEKAMKPRITTCLGPHRTTTQIVKMRQENRSQSKPRANVHLVNHVHRATRVLDGACLNPRNLL